MCKYKGGKPTCAMKVTVVGTPWGAQSAGQYPSGVRSECEHTCWDPKVSIVLSLLGVTGYITPSGLDYSALMVFSLIWGMGGAFISLQMSRFMAKMAMSVQLVDGTSGQPELDWLHQTVGHLSRKAGLPMPEVGIYDSPEVNAFATGPSKSRSLVAVSTGLLRSMRREEVEGVLAHEVAHIANGDMVTLTLIQGVVNAFVLFFSRIIANLVRQMVDEKISSLVFFVTTIVFDIAFGILGSMVVAWFSRARVPGRRRRRAAGRQGQHDWRPAAADAEQGHGRHRAAPAGGDEDFRRTERVHVADFDPPAAGSSHRRPAEGSDSVTRREGV